MDMTLRESLSGHGWLRESSLWQSTMCVWNKTKNKSSAANASESTRIKERIYAGSTNNHRIVAKCHEKLRRDCRAEGSEPGRTGRRAAGGARAQRSGQEHIHSAAARALAAPFG